MWGAGSCQESSRYIQKTTKITIKNYWHFLCAIHIKTWILIVRPDRDFEQKSKSSDFFKKLAKTTVVFQEMEPIVLINVFLYKKRSV